MALRAIRMLGDEILTKPCREVKEMTPRLQELVEDMLETMYNADGIGLAAPQVGVLRQIVVIDIWQDGIVEPTELTEDEEPEEAEAAGTETSEAEMSEADAAEKKAAGSEEPGAREAGSEEPGAREAGAKEPGAAETEAGAAGEDEPEPPEEPKRPAPPKMTLISGKTDGTAAYAGQDRQGSSDEPSETGSSDEPCETDSSDKPCETGSLDESCGTGRPEDYEEDLEEDFEEDWEGPLIMVNPIITKKEGTQTADEGCLSFPGKVGRVTRPAYIEVTYFDENMDEYELEAEGLLARAICHEVDHLSGHMYVEFVEGEIREAGSHDSEDEEEEEEEEEE